jgi:hypothetical protein
MFVDEYACLTKPGYSTVPNIIHSVIMCIHINLQSHLAVAYEILDVESRLSLTDGVHTFCAITYFLSASSLLSLEIQSHSLIDQRQFLRSACPTSLQKSRSHTRYKYQSYLQFCTFAGSLLYLWALPPKVEIEYQVFIQYKV